MQTGSVTLNDATSPQFANYQGLQNNYGVFHFNVPPGRTGWTASHRRVPAATRANGHQRPGAADPDRPAGRLAAHSLPQGVGQLRQRGRAQPGRRAPGPA